MTKDPVIQLLSLHHVCWDILAICYPTSTYFQRGKACGNKKVQQSTFGIFCLEFDTSSFLDLAFWLRERMCISLKHCVRPLQGVQSQLLMTKKQALGRFHAVALPPSPHSPKFSSIFGQGRGLWCFGVTP